MKHVSSHVLISLLLLALTARMGLPPEYVDAGSVELEHELTMGEETGTIFGRIGDLAADSAGRIFVTDQENIHVRVFRPSGDSLATFGRKGEGPGEFDRPSTVLTDEGRVIVEDGYDSQILVFNGEPPFNVIRSFTPTRGKVGRPGRPYAVSDSGMVLRYTPSGRFKADGYVRGPDQRIAQIDQTGEIVKDSLLILEGRELIMEVEGTRRSLSSYAFSRHTAFDIGPDGAMYVGRTDSLRFAKFASDGVLLTTVRFAYQPIPVTEEDMDSLLAKRDGRWRKMLENADVPANRPAFRDLIVDEQGRVWLDVTNNPDRQNTLWLIVDVERQQVWRTQLDRDVTIHEIRGGKIYGVHRDQYGVQEVVVYRVSGLGRA